MQPPAGPTAVRTITEDSAIVTRCPKVRVYSYKRRHGDGGVSSQLDGAAGFVRTVNAPMETGTVGKDVLIACSDLNYSPSRPRATEILQDQRRYMQTDTL
jgi:hypothetical protein